MGMHHSTFAAMSREEDLGQGFGALMRRRRRDRICPSSGRAYLVAAPEGVKLYLDTTNKLSLETRVDEAAKCQKRS